MAKLLFKLNQVPDDEAFEVRALLDEHGVEYYETTSGNWGVSMAGIWLSEADDFERAKALLDDYQAERVLRMRAEQSQREAEGETDTFATRVGQRPLQVLSVLVFIAVIVYVTIVPFIGMFSS